MLSDKILLPIVKEVGIVNIIKEYIPNEYLLISENNNKLQGRFIFEYEIESMFKIQINDVLNDNRLRVDYITTPAFIFPIKPFKHYQFITHDAYHEFTRLVTKNSVKERPSFEIKCLLDGNFQSRNNMIVNQKYASPCGRCYEKGNDYCFYHVDDLYMCEYYELLCQECNGNQFCDCDTCSIDN
jgi:hypothetical protein